MILSLVKRNLKLYFRDKASVFFSMLGVIIIIGLYAAFLGDMMVSYAEREFSGSGINVRFLMDSWIMAGVVIVATITTTLGSYGIAVTDNASKIIFDFKVSPIKRSTIVLSYLISAFFVGLIMSLVSLTVGELYIKLSGGELLSFLGFLKTLGIIVLSVMMNASISFFIITFIKSNNAFGAVNTVFGSVIGFLMGVYIPIGNLPLGLQTIIKFVPFSHPAVLLRQVMMSEAVNLEYMPREFILFSGIHYEWNGEFMSNFIHIGYILIITVVFFLLGVLTMSRKRKQ
ncbi:MAG: ABC transporter permease [Bacilli bacterium]|nr:ABC transporter permease [Bacilli bacterium]MBN2877776.1 ABC transporter permease [Bacilli bacterium]